MAVRILNNGKKVVQAAAAVCLIMIFYMAARLDSAGNKTGMENQNKKEFWKAATYFADEWVMNFWSSEMDHIDEDFEQIQKDGFNSIILVIPWHEFQPRIYPAEYNTYAFDRLAFVMDKAEQHGLGVIVRVGYVWDYYDDQNDPHIYQRYYDYMTEETIRHAWRDYLKQLYALLAKYDAYKGAFITWEDWWGCVSLAQQTVGKSRESIRMADEIGYQDYMMKNYSVAELRDIFQDSAIYDRSDIYIPPSEEKAFSTFYDFYDEFLNQLLAESQEIIPDLSMEIRADKDPVYDHGQVEYYSHEQTYDCLNSSYVTMVYGIPMGFENKGEEVTADEALEKTAYILDSINTVTDNKRLFIDQFLFFDNTPEFYYNAKLKPEEVGSYLEKAASVLYEKTGGYGIWTYQDYDASMLYNSQFALGMDGWTVEGEAEIINEGSNRIKLQAGAILSQAVDSSRNHFPGKEVTVELDAELTDAAAADLVITVGNRQKRIPVSESGRVSMTFTDDGNYDLSIISEADLVIDNVKLYSYTQNGLLYDHMGKPLDGLSGMRRLNAVTDEKIRMDKIFQNAVDLLDVYDRADVSGYRQSKDYPWNKNAGMIDMNGKNRALFLTPDVSVRLSAKVSGDQNVLFLEYGMYPQAVSWNVSDGAVIQIDIEDAKGRLLETVGEFEVDPLEAECRKVQLSLDAYTGEEIRVVVHCLPGPDGNYDGDWVILKRLALIGQDAIAGEDFELRTLGKERYMECRIRKNKEISKEDNGK